MTPEQALQLLMQVLVLKGGLSLQDTANAIHAWNVLAEMVSKKETTPEIGE